MRELWSAAELGVDREKESGWQEMHSFQLPSTNQISELSRAVPAATARRAAPAEHTNV